MPFKLIPDEDPLESVHAPDASERSIRTASKDGVGLEMPSARAL